MWGRRRARGGAGTADVRRCDRSAIALRRPIRRGDVAVRDRAAQAGRSFPVAGARRAAPNADGSPPDPARDATWSRVRGSDAHRRDAWFASRRAARRAGLRRSRRPSRGGGGPAPREEPESHGIAALSRARQLPTRVRRRGRIMTEGQILTTEQVDALIRRLDVGGSPDPRFVASSHAALEGPVQRARAEDATRLGRFRRDVRQAMGPATAPRTVRSTRVFAILLLLALAVVAGAAIAGALNRRPLGANGLLVVSVQGQLQAIDPVGGSWRSILPAGAQAQGVSRSPDGSVVTFWTSEGGRSRLFAI